MRIPLSVLPEFNELYVVSDLHLGGPSGFQIFNAGSQFARMADEVRTRANSDRRIGLLVNGDLVDFLAERPFAHFDPAGALDKLERIVADSAFQPVWQSLQRFANTTNCHLLINLGNHDLELALPWVRARLLDILSNNVEQARGRLTLAFDGTGIRCRVGSAEVLAIHGNEVDDWNVADYEMIRRIGRDVTQGMGFDPWIPNAGSRLVIEVMNDVKSRFPFVDLLKPEIGAVIPTILALAPDQRSKIDAIRRTVGRLMLDKLRRRVGLLGEEELRADERVVPAMSRDAIPSSAGRRGASVVAFNSRDYALALLDEAEERLAQDTQPLSLIDNDARGSYLGARAAIVNVFRRSGAVEVLREALERLGDDRSFDLTNEDAQFQLLDEQIGDVDFLVAGHTHLERVIPRRRGRGTYFNSGTWVRLIRFDKVVLSDQAQFAAIFDAFKTGTMEALDTQGNLVMRRPAVVAICADQGRVTAELRHVGLGPGDPVMASVPNTRVDG